MAGLYGMPTGKPKTPSVYPYGQGSEVVGRDKGKKSKTTSREVNKGPKGGRR